MDVGVDLRPQAVDQLLVAVLDRIQADIAVISITKFFSALSPLVLWASVAISIAHHLEEAFRGRILDLAIQQFSQVMKAQGCSLSCAPTPS